ncbi:MAG: hypothetical protein IPJ41_14000 [Phycisphaerales bacterium]|nr:hypothetical protein [Phycisphaerales bacterium]
MTRFYGVFLSAGVIAAAGAGAHAGPVYVQLQGHNLGRGVVVSLSGGLTFADGSTSSTLWAGERSFRIDGQLARAFSAELTNANGDGWYQESSVRGGPNEEKAQAIAALFAGRAGNLANQDQAATFQALLWELVYDFDGSEGSIDMAGGHVAFGLIDGALFDDMKRTALRMDLSGSVALLSSDKYNNQFRVVPLPPAAGLAALGLLGCAARRRRSTSSMAM